MAGPNPLLSLSKSSPEGYSFLLGDQREFLIELGWGLMTRQPLWVILRHLPEKGRREIEEIVEEEIVEETKEMDWGERKMNESEETEKIKTFPLYPYLLQV